MALALPFEIGALLQGINTPLFFHTQLPPEEQVTLQAKESLQESASEGEQESSAVEHRARM